MVLWRRTPLQLPNVARPLGQRSGHFQSMPMSSSLILSAPSPSALLFPQSSWLNAAIQKNRDPIIPTSPVCELCPRQQSLTRQWQRDGEGFEWLGKWLVTFTPIVKNLFYSFIISQNIPPNSVAFDSVLSFFLLPSQRLVLTGLGRTG